MFLILYLYIAKLLDKNMLRRWDGSPALPYFSPSDLGIDEKRFNFMSGPNQLSGSKYFINGQKHDDLVIFFHGLGAGRNAYLKEISELVKRGHLVYAFDYTGCMQSEGRNIKGLGQPLIDTKHFFDFLNKDKESKNLKRYVIGHSWGGYIATHTLCNDEYKITKGISIAGFSSPETQYCDMAPQLRKFRPILKLYLNSRVKKYGNIDVIPTLKKCNKEYLYIQGSNDKTVPCEHNGYIIKKISDKNKSIKTKIVNNRGHNVYMSKDSEEYVSELLAKGINKPNNLIDLKMDINKATKEDQFVMKTIFDFLDH